MSTVRTRGGVVPVARAEDFTPGQIAAALSDEVGPQLVGFSLGVSDSTLRRWVKEQTSPSFADEKRLRDLYALVTFMLRTESRHVVRAWLLGMNPELDDRSPAEVIADGQIAVAMGAARLYVGDIAIDDGGNLHDPDNRIALRDNPDPDLVIR